MKQHLGSRALIVLPAPEGRIQNLGPFRTGRMMETDIVAGSAILAPATESGEMILVKGKVPIWFEGNLVEAENLRRFHERLTCAAGRMKTGYGTIAKGEVPIDQLSIIGLWDMDRMIALEIGRPSLLEEWSGEPVTQTLPRRVPSGTILGEATKDLLAAGGRMMCQAPFMFQFLNGQILIQTSKDAVVFDHDDLALLPHLRDASIPKEDLPRYLGRDLAQIL